MSKILSIIIPTYNAEKFLNKGLSSFLICRNTDETTAYHNYVSAKDDRFEEIDVDMNMLDKLEIIVVNDGTPDNSVSVAQRFVNWYPGTFKIINKENGGHGSAINIGVEHVSGKYFKVVDADDWADTLALKHLINSLEHTEADAIIQSFRYYDISKNEYRPADIKVPDFNREYGLNDVLNMWDDVYDGLSFHGVLYNTAFYKSLNYSLAEHVFYEDQEYATVPFSFAETIRFVEEELYV